MLNRTIYSPLSYNILPLTIIRCTNNLKEVKSIVWRVRR